MMDETGKQYGKWTILSYISPEERTEQNRDLAWLAQCECGTIRPVRISDLRNGKSRSCGCASRNRSIKVELNKKYGKLTPVERLKNRHGNYLSQYRCLCDCGNEIILKGSHIGKKTNCGCEFGEGFTKHNSNIGARFGKLTILADSERKDKNGKRAYRLCQCDCGNICEVAYGHLTSGHTLSCGCIESFGEEMVSEFLTANNICFKRQFRFDGCVDKVRLPFDFAVFIDGKIGLIEVQGKQHFNDDLLFWSEDLIRHDKIKSDYCQSHSLPLLLLDYSKGKSGTKKEEINLQLKNFIEEIKNNDRE